MAEPFPEDLYEFLDECGLQNRMGRFQSNVVSGFASGIVVAELINAKHPKSINIHSYKDASNLKDRLVNWNHLVKVLSSFSVQLTDQEINNIASRSDVTAVEVVAFLRLLREKLKFAPSKALRRGTVATERRSTIKSSTVADTNIRTRKPSMAVSNRFLENIEEKKRISKRVSMMDPQTIDSMYQDLSFKFKEEMDEKMKEANILDKRSAELDSHIAALREQNLSDLKKVEKRLSMLELDNMHVTASEVGEGQDGSNNNLPSAPQATSFRSSVSTKSSRGSVSVGSRSSMSKPSSPTKSKPLACTPVPQLLPVAEGEDERREPEVEVQEANIPPPPAPVLDKDSYPPSLTFQRILSDEYHRHYYVNMETGASQWTAPLKGIIKCIDEGCPQPVEFYVDAATGQSMYC